MPSSLLSSAEHNTRFAEAQSLARESDRHRPYAAAAANKFTRALTSSTQGYAPQCESRAILVRTSSSPLRYERRLSICDIRLQIHRPFGAHYGCRRNAIVVRLRPQRLHQHADDSLRHHDFQQIIAQARPSISRWTRADKDKKIATPLLVL